MVNMTQGADVNRYRWYFADVGEEYAASSFNTEHIFTSPGKIPVALVVQNKFGCTDTMVRYVDVQPEFLIYIPDAFSPNGDGVNEVFIPVASGFTDFKMAIFDRWGEEVYTTSDISRGWNGNRNGKECEEGSYIARIEFKGHNYERKSVTKRVMLMR